MIPRLFGRPDGFFIRLRCAVFNHRWERCYDLCCHGELRWCRWCLRNDATHLEHHK